MDGLQEATQRTIGQFDAAVLEIDAEEAQELACVCTAMQRLRVSPRGLLTLQRLDERASALQYILRVLQDEIRRIHICLHSRTRAESSSNVQRS